MTFNELHSVESQKMELFTITVMRISNHTPSKVVSSGNASELYSSGTRIEFQPLAVLNEISVVLLRPFIQILG
jgi:hypothetical protein